MNRSLLLPAAYLIDQVAGDPEWFPHPVRFIGSAISAGEARLRSPGQSHKSELLAGAGLTIVVVGSTYWLTTALLHFVRRRSNSLANAVELSLAWTCLAARNLEQEATSVTDALQVGNLSRARSRLSRIVGRDTANLGEQAMSRAVIECVAESASDGIMAPLFYMCLGGVPLAMAYKAVNTLDSMIGHADSRYFYFGKLAARLDDAANYVPSRICALTLVAASRLMRHSDAKAAWNTWHRDGPKHRSPNAGQPESAMAGALHVALGGENTYAGEVIQTPRLGAEFRNPSPQDAVQAVRLVSVASLIGLGLTLIFRLLRQSKEST